MPHPYERTFRDMDLDQLEQRAHEIVAMPDEQNPEWGFSERDEWISALKYVLILRQDYLGEMGDHTHPSDRESHDALDAEYDRIVAIQAILAEQAV